jgi:hypothetical protein
LELRILKSLQEVVRGIADYIKACRQTISARTGQNKVFVRNCAFQRTYGRKSRLKEKLQQAAALHMPEYFPDDIVLDLA